MMGRASAVALAITLSASACTSDEAANGDNGVIGSTTSGDATTTETVELLPYDEDGDFPDGPDADDDAVDDGEAVDDAPATTVAAGENNGDNDGDNDAATTLGSIVPPGDDDNDDDVVSTTSQPTSTNPPLNGDEEQPLQEESSALACATVELGYLQQLGGNDGSDRLREGAAMAIQSGVGEYVTAGQGLVDALDADSGVDGAADALLSQCETDGFERLA